jgi:hypothetical protein
VLCTFGSFLKFAATNISRRCRFSKDLNETLIFGKNIFSRRCRFFHGHGIVVIRGAAHRNICRKQSSCMI